MDATADYLTLSVVLLGLLALAVIFVASEMVRRRRSRRIREAWRAEFRAKYKRG